MQGVPDVIVERQIGLFDCADPAYGAGVRAAVATQREQTKGVLTR
jgi:catalase